MREAYTVLLTFFMVGLAFGVLLTAMAGLGLALGVVAVSMAFGFGFVIAKGVYET